MARAKRERDESPSEDQNRSPSCLCLPEEVLTKRARKTTALAEPVSYIRPANTRRSNVAAVKSTDRKRKTIVPATAERNLGPPRDNSCPSCMRSDCRGLTRHYLSPKRIKRSPANHLEVEEHDVIMKRYVVEKLLGEGTFGKVYAVKDLQKDGQGRELALKITKDTDEARQDFSYEANVLKELLMSDPKAEHLFLRLYADFIYHSHPCLVVERLGPSLYKFLHMNDFRPLPPDQLRHVAHQMCYALGFLHQNRIIHTDLKTDNIVFVHVPREAKSKSGPQYKMDNTAIRVVDFGSAIFEHEHHGSSITTRQYRAPEVFLKRGWSYPCDVWSAACIIFELYYGKTMFENCETITTQLALMEHIFGKIPPAVSGSSTYYVNGRLNYDKRCSKFIEIKAASCAGPLKNNMRDDDEDTRQLFLLLEEMFRYDQLKRITLAKALKHDYFKKLKPGQKRE